MEILLENVQFIRQNLKDIALWLGLFLFLYVIGLFVPEGYDWEHYFSKGIVHPIWPPWTLSIVRLLNMPLITAITLFSIIARSFKYDKSPASIALAVLSLPTLWVIFMGNLDGIVLLGLLSFPWGAPLVLMKPQLASFSILAKKNSLLVGLIWILFSFLIWGFWPMRFLMVLSPEWKTEWIQDISLFPWGLLVAVPLMWFSRGDEDLLMAAGSLGTPHLFPYHFIVLMPSLARMQWSWRIITWFVSWMPLLANWFGEWAWHFGNLMSVCFWFGIYLSKSSDKKDKNDEIGELETCSV